MVAKQEMIRKVEVVDLKYHFRGIGEQVTTSLIKLQVSGALGGQDVHMFQASLALHHWFAMTIFFRGVHQPMFILVAAGWRARQRGLKAKLMVSDDLAVGGDVLAANGHHDDDTTVGESDGNSGTSASTGSDTDVVPEKRRRRAFIQLSPALQSECKKLQQVATRGSGLSNAE